jgi:hypothetical protein
MIGLKKEPSYMRRGTTLNSTMDDVAITFYPTGKPSIVLTCEVAKTVSEKTKGLMYRSSLPNEKGMLFFYWFSWLRIFWMKNVSIPLDIIFINKEFKVVSINETSADVGIFNKKFWAHGFGKYVIECNSGFCKNHHISIGTNIMIQGIKRDTKKYFFFASLFSVLYFFFVSQNYIEKLFLRKKKKSRLYCFRRIFSI